MTRKEYGTFLVSQLPESNKDGNLITKEGDLLLYIQWYVGAVVFFFIARFAIRFFFEKIIKKENFMKMDEQGKQRYLEKWTSNFHHLLI